VEVGWDERQTTCFFCIFELTKKQTMNYYKIIYWTHVLSVNLFLLIYLIKTVQLLMNKNQALDKFKKITRVPEMIVSTLFLVTGIYMITQIPEVKSLLIVKLVAVAISIPIAIVGFKKNNKGLAVLSLLLIIGAYGMAEMSKKQASARKPADGDTVGTKIDSVKVTANTPEEVDPNGFSIARAKKIYSDNCSTCHGADGKLGKAGAADLSKSSIDAMAAKEIVTNGKSPMMGYGEQLNSSEINAIVNYIQGFKQK
jgi:mono/diheme cytochrome c family protein